MKLDNLKEAVFHANLDLVEHGLVIFTWETLAVLTGRITWW